MTTTAPTPLSWAPPAKGDWRGLHDHFPRALTPEYQLLLADGMSVGEAVWIERYGLPVRTIDPAFIHGRVFISAAPLLGPRTDAFPPDWAMRLAMRLVPAFRRRARAAEAAVQERPWLAEATRWFEVEGPAWRHRNAANEAVAVEALDDVALAEHLATVRVAVGEGYRAHFRLHGPDLIPTGMLLARTTDWGLDPMAVTALLVGSSPASRGAEAPPPWCLLSGYDLDERCAAELPARPTAPHRPPMEPDPTREAALRAQVPDGDRAEWDRLLDDARRTYGVRDDNGLLTAAWPAGLLRRAMLAVGDRLVARGQLDDREHAVELTVAELQAALAGDPEAPTAAVAAERLTARQRLSQVAAPPQLGPPTDLPLAALPPGMRRIAAGLLVVRDLGLTELTEQRDLTDRVDEAHLHGVGIGGGAVVGRACVATLAADAMARFEPGDIVVTAGTCPAWNSILALAGGVVTEEGGPLSHAAIIARELDLPAIVGCVGAMAQVPDGASVELDPAAGTLRVLP